uniref:Phosphatidylethanolamine-binding protein n=1 Tax=Candidatus Kentrum sp. LFY TaxID=2126342 RepID=A0A450WVP0_9GAMM|nr:MAG: Phosphatidylethanolamine-binding protein [Candidatus Kentron sp. LFY]
MKLHSPNFGNNQPIPGDHAFCIPDPENHVTFGGNKNPALSWSDVPADAKSLVLICHDSDVPSKPDDVN